MALLRNLKGKIMKKDLLGRKISDKQIKREILKENVGRGKAGERNVKAKYEWKGYHMERSPRGRDFIARKRKFGGKLAKEKIEVEVKTGRAKTSKLQKKTQKKSKNYKVERVHPYGFGPRRLKWEK